MQRLNALVHQFQKTIYMKTKRKLNLALIALIAGMAVSCEKETTNGNGIPSSENPTQSTERTDGSTIVLDGEIYALGCFTSFMYGTHGITTDGVNYALTSELVQLDDYIGVPVTIHAEVVAGYPIDGGPEFLNVTEIIQ
jgi:hypothetical protein